jgi:hypothetical protein
MLGLQNDAIPCDCSIFPFGGFGRRGASSKDNMAPANIARPEIHNGFLKEIFL